MEENYKSKLKTFSKLDFQSKQKLITDGRPTPERKGLLQTTGQKIKDWFTRKDCPCLCLSRSKHENPPLTFTQSTVRSNTSNSASPETFLTINSPPIDFFNSPTIPLQSTQPHHEAYMSLMRGLRELNFNDPSVPCDLLLTGDQAFPLAMNSQGQVLMAASLYGSGRIVVLSHETYLKLFPTLVENALTWLRGDGSNNLSVGVQQNLKAVADRLNKSKFQVNIVGEFSNNLGVGVYVTDAYSVGEDPKDLVAFLKAGGGVLIAGQAWNWAASHPEKNIILDFPGNKVSSVAGIYFSDIYGHTENLPVYPQIPSSWKALRVGKDFRDDWGFLLKGISELSIAKDCVASEVLVHGPLSFPIGTTEDGRTFLAGSYYGKGRVIVVSHEAQLKIETMAPFWNNAINWLDENRKGVIGVSPDLDQAFNLYSELGFNCRMTTFRKDLSVFVCTAYTEENEKEIQDFVAEGGGLLIGGHVWWWAYTHPNPMTDFSGNKILNKMGLSLLEKTIDEGSYKVLDLTQSNSHFCHLLRRVAAHVIKGEELTKYEEKSLKKLGSDCVSYLQTKAGGWYFYSLVSTLTDMLKKSGISQVNEQNPAKNPRDLFLLSVATEVFKACPNPDAVLPYLIKENLEMPVVNNKRIQINVNTAGNEEWISTGLYLVSGMRTYMIFPAEIINKGWMIQIGCQTDFLNAEQLSRAPRVCEQFPVTTDVMQVCNLWGGLLYLVAPPNTKVESVEVIVQTAVLAPYYKFGETTAADWSLLCKAPSPWAELEFENIILTVPSEAVRDLEHPDEVAAQWNKIMRAVADLAARPLTFSRKERIVTDVQISHGWMHSGYPIMAMKSVAKDLLTVQNMWGPIHVLGHKQQRDCWEFPPHTTECTCGLWLLYVHEEVLRINRDQAHLHLTVAERATRVKEYVNGGRDLSKWCGWVALETYLQLQERFGWDAIKRVFAAYHTMSNFPGDNKGKMNLYAETFSQTVQMNLCGFFKAWGWPIEASTEEKLSNLLPWTDHPLAKYG